MSETVIVATRPLPVDMRIAAVFAGIGPQATAKTQRLHEAFYELAHDHPDLLAGLTFVTLSDYPHSPELESALYRLQNAGLVGAINPRYDKLEVRVERLERVLDQMRTIDAETTDRLKELGASVREQLSGSAL